MNLMFQSLRFHCLLEDLSQFHPIPVLLELDAKPMKCLNIELSISLTDPLSNWRHHAEAEISCMNGWLSPIHAYMQKAWTFSSWLTIDANLLLSYYSICIQNRVGKFFSQHVLYFVFELQKSFRHTHSRSYELCADIHREFFTG